MNKKIISITLSLEMINILKEKAKQLGISMSSLIEMLIRESSVIK